MTKAIITISMLLAATGIGLGQVGVEYRSEGNPLYWANRKPRADYWQQDVHYRIKADIDEQTDVVTGFLALTYFNNSPDTLREVFFHLYQNAFQPQSHLADLERANGAHHHFGEYEAQGLGTAIDRMSVNGRSAIIEVDNTIARVRLSEPLLPGGKAEFSILFRTFFDQGSMGRRMKKFDASGHTHYDGVHWYPRIAVYDERKGWDTDQHLGHEFYGDFGTFEAELTFASNYVVEATGVLLNREEVLPDELRKRLDIGNFKNKPWDEPASEVVPYDPAERKTWKYRAINVHDFAFTADPTYRIGEAMWNGVQCVALVQEPHASGWQNAAQYTAAVIKAFSHRIGLYHYPKMVVADAQDGMEYPMLTLDGDSDPDYRGLLVHEIGHNWFYGQVGSNETYRASLDEGFTEYLTALGLRDLEGDTLPLYAQNIWERLFLRPQRPLDTEAYTGYMQSAAVHREPALNTHSDHFGPDYMNGYVHVYYKTATMLFNLEYVLGDTLFAQVMKDYYTRWKFCHPYPEDFRHSARLTTRTDLDWFFDEWMEKTSHIDYAVGRIRKSEGEGRYSIRLKRKGDLHMPLDVRVIDHEGTTHDYHIPNTWFVKQTTAKVLPKWYSLDAMHRTYDMEVVIPEGIKEVLIDTSHRLADIYMPDNARKLPIRISFDHQLQQAPDWKRYEVRARPSFWYNGYDGVKMGVYLGGGHMEVNHVFNLRVWFNSGFGQYGVPEAIKNEHQEVSAMFDYRTSLSRWWRQSEVFLDLKAVDGLYGGSLGLRKKSRSDRTTYSLWYKTMYRHDARHMQYLLRPGQWEVATLNNSLNAEVRHTYPYRNGTGELVADIRASAIGSGADFHRLRLSAINRTDLWRLRLSTRLFAQLGTGSRVPKESALYLDGADPEALMDNQYTRSYGFIPATWGTYGGTINHFNAGGGLGLRSYAGYLAPETTPDGSVLAYQGMSGAAINAELDLAGIFGPGPRVLRKYFGLATYLFADCGLISTNAPGSAPRFAQPRLDAGVGLALTIKRWGFLEMAKPLTIRFDMPVFLNRTPALQPNHWDFRYVVGVSRAF